MSFLDITPNKAYHCYACIYHCSAHTHLSCAVQSMRGGACNECGISRADCIATKCIASSLLQQTLILSLYINYKLQCDGYKFNTRDTLLYVY